MSMHKSYRNDMQYPAGQVVYQPKTLEKEIEEYRESLKNCRCNDQPVEKCETCPLKENANCQ